MASILDLAAVISERTGMDERIVWLQGKGLLATGTRTAPRAIRPCISRAGVTQV